MQYVYLLYSQFQNKQSISQRIIFDYSPLELFHILFGAIFIFLQFDWLKVYSALLTRQ